MKKLRRLTKSHTTVLLTIQHTNTICTGSATFFHSIKATSDWRWQFQRELFTRNKYILFGEWIARDF